MKGSINAVESLLAHKNIDVNMKSVLLYNYFNEIGKYIFYLVLLSFSHNFY